jgi:hypothetical protein
LPHGLPDPGWTSAPGLVWIHERRIPGDFRRRTWPLTSLVSTRESLTALLNVLLMQPFQTEQFRFVYDTSVSIGGTSRGDGIGIANYNEETYCRVHSQARIQPLAPAHLSSDPLTRHMPQLRYRTGYCKQDFALSARSFLLSLTFYRPIVSTVDIPWGLSREAGVAIKQGHPSTSLFWHHAPCHAHSGESGMWSRGPVAGSWDMWYDGDVYCPSDTVQAGVRVLFQYHISV